MVHRRGPTNRFVSQWELDRKRLASFDLPLTPRSGQLFLALHDSVGQWVELAYLAKRIWSGVARYATVRVTIQRTREQLKGSRWRIDSRTGYGQLRLVDLEHEAKNAETVQRLTCQLAEHERAHR